MTSRWPTTRAKYLFQETDVRGREGPLLAATQDRGVVRRDDLDYRVWNPTESSSYKYVQRGDFVISLRSFQGGIEITHENGLVSPAYTTLRSRLSDTRFYRWLFKSKVFVGDLASRSTGIRQGKSISSGQFLDMSLPVPPTGEQKLIADFLDRETHRIDALVDAKRRMIDLLGEKRESSITRWIWSAGRPTTRLSFHADLLACHAFPSSEFSTSPDDIATLRGANIGVGQTRWDETVYWSEAKTEGLERYRLNSKDIVLGLDRPWITGGIRVAMIEDEDLPALLLQRVLRIRAKPSINQRFVFYLLQSRPFLAHFEPDMTGISVPHISPDQVGDFSFPAYEVGEQTTIVEELDRLTSIIDSATSTLSRQLDLLAEYRRALITQAVTGQLDEATLKGNKPTDVAVGVIPE